MKIIIYPIILIVFLAINISYGYSFDGAGQDKSEEMAARKLLGPEFVREINKQLLTSKRVERYQKKNRRIERKKVTPASEEVKKSTESDSDMNFALKEKAGSVKDQEK